MKKLLILISTALMAILPLCAEDSLFSFSAGISSGFPIYGKDSTISTGSEISNGNRVIIGTTAAINLNPIKHVSFYLGNDLLWDTTWNASEKSQKLHVSFPLGIKIYPGIGGLNCGLAYTLGFRYDNIKTDEAGEHNDSTPWGNGFKIQVEYNFAHEGSSKYLPSIGTYWNLMPRGNNSYDNLIVLYISANF